MFTSIFCNQPQPQGRQPCSLEMILCHRDSLENSGNCFHEYYYPNCEIGYQPQTGRMARVYEYFTRLLAPSSLRWREIRAADDRSGWFVFMAEAH